MLKDKTRPQKCSRLKKAKERQLNVIPDTRLYLVLRGKKCNKE